MFSGRAGAGVVVARLEDGSWSAPSAIGTGGMGFGGQIGAEITDFVIVLNSREAVKSFTTGGNVTLGGNLSGNINMNEVRNMIESDQWLTEPYCFLTRITTNSRCWTHW